MKIKTVIAASLISVPLLAGPAVAIGVPPLPAVGVGIVIPPMPSPVPLPDLSGAPKGEVGREGASRDAKHCKHDYDCDGARDEIGSAENQYRTRVLPHTGAGENVALALAGIGLIALGGIAYSISKRQDR